MNEDYEKFKKGLMKKIPQMQAMPVYQYDDNEMRLHVALRAAHDTLENKLAIAKQVLSEDLSCEEMQQYLEQERTRAAITVKRLDHVINGGWS